MSGENKTTGTLLSKDVQIVVGNEHIGYGVHTMRGADLVLDERSVTDEYWAEFTVPIDGKGYRAMKRAMKKQKRAKPQRYVFDPATLRMVPAKRWYERLSDCIAKAVSDMIWMWKYIQ